MVSCCVCGSAQVLLPSKLTPSVPIPWKRRNEPAGAARGKVVDVVVAALTTLSFARISEKGAEEDMFRPPQCHVFGAQPSPIAFCSGGGPQPADLSGV